MSTVPSTPTPTATVPPTPTPAATEPLGPLGSKTNAPTTLPTPTDTATAPVIDEVKERNLRHVLGDYAVDALVKTKEGVSAAQQLSNGTNAQYADLANYEGVVKPKAFAEKTGKEWTPDDFKRTTAVHGKELNPNKELVIRHLVDRQNSTELMQRTQGWGARPGGAAAWKKGKK